MPKFEPDFENTRVTTRIFEKGDYEIAIKRVKGIGNRNAKDVVTAGVMLFPQMVGSIDSRGRVTDNFAGEEVSPIRLYVHNDGSMRATKRALMALFGYDGRDEDAEKEFNQFYKSSDFSVDVEETDDGWEATLGAGWNMLVDKHVIVRLDKRIYEPEGGEPQEQQDVKFWTPVKTA